MKTEQRFRLRDVLRYNLKTVRAYLLKEAFQRLWDYHSPACAGKFLDEWCRAVNEQGGFGTWVWDVSRHPADVKDILVKHGG